MKIQCARHVKGERCPKKATMYVAGSSNANYDWSGYFCDNHSHRIVKVRMRLIKRHKQIIIIRPITVWDKQKIKEKRK